MKTIAPLLLATAAALALSTGSALADAPFVPFTLTFDSLPSGSAANLFAPIGLDIRFGVIALDEDLDGIEIPGTGHWVIDPAAPDVLAQNPALFSYGAAPSPGNALNAKDQAVLLLFGVPIDVTQFHAVLDNSPLGNLGSQNVEFYDAADTLLFSTAIDETMPGYVINTETFIPNVSKIVLPNNAFYDNVTVVPEPGAAVTLLGGLGLFISLRRRRSA